MVNEKKKSVPRDRDQFDPLGKYQGEIFDCVVLDGSNIITTNVPVTDGNKAGFAIERLPKTIRAVQKLGWPTLVAMKKGTYSYAIRHADEKEFPADQRKLLKEMVESLEVSLIDSKEDDLWLWNAAIARNGWVLSHDSFNKEIKKYREQGNSEIVSQIKTRRAWLEFVGNEPSFTLPSRDSETIIATKIQERRDKVSEMVEELTHVEAELGIEGHGTTQIKLEIGVPLGRKDLKKAMDHEEMAKVSGSHFILHRNSSVLTITDLESTNGTAINGMRIPNDQAFPIEDGSELLIGSRRVTLQF